MSEQSTVDERYYEVARQGSLAERLMVVARDRIYADFLRLIRPQPGETILDVGASDVLTDAANTLERKYPYPEAVTAVGLGEAGEFQAVFPKIRYRQIEAGAPLPFADASFDAAMSNAVLEHVGSLERQGAFVGELARVARRVFISVPHRYFPVEHHTGIPVLHFWDESFVLACRTLGKAEWLDPASLILMTRRRLAATAPAGRSISIGYTGLRLGPLSSNLYLVIEAL